MIGLLGKKLGMTHVYDEYGRRLAATAIQAGPCTVIGCRERSRHGYEAVQLGFEPIKDSQFRYIREFRCGSGDWQVGQQVTVELFQDWELVDVTGTSIGKGFQGGVKRWKWSGGGATHGSMSHRAPGSIGSTTTPGRVWRGHHLPGHMGLDRVTVQNVRIVRRDPEHHLLLVEGAVPGARTGLLMITKARKRPGVTKQPQAFQEIIEEDETLSKTAKAMKKAPKTS